MTPGSEQITIELRQNAQSAMDVTIRSSRTAKAASVLQGKKPDKAASLLPLLFSLCGTAQHQAGLCAMEEALGMVASPAVKDARKLMLCAESISEHITRILIDWPQLADTAPKAEIVRLLRKDLAQVGSLVFAEGQKDKIGGGTLDLQAQELRTLFEKVIEACETHIFEKPLEAFMVMVEQGDFQNWLKSAKTTPAKCLDYWSALETLSLPWPKANLLPSLNKNTFSEQFKEQNLDHFLKAPTLDNKCCETGPLHRQINHLLIQSMSVHKTSGTMIRLCAKLLDLGFYLQRALQILDHFSQDQALYRTKRTDQGLCCVDAVRGQLWHHVLISPEDSRVLRYRILAPTEWNFHPDGILKDSLSMLSPEEPEKLEKQARLAVLALDPCVGCDIILPAAQG